MPTPPQSHDTKAQQQKDQEIRRMAMGVKA